MKKGHASSISELHPRSWRMATARPHLARGNRTETRGHPFALSPLSRRAILAQHYVKASSLPAETPHVERDLNREMPTATRPNENGD